MLEGRQACQSTLCEGKLERCQAWQAHMKYECSRGPQRAFSAVERSRVQLLMVSVIDHSRIFRDYQVPISRDECRKRRQS